MNNSVAQKNDPIPMNDKECEEHVAISGIPLVYDLIVPPDFRTHYIILEAKANGLASHRKSQCKKCGWVTNSSGKTRLCQHIQGRAKIGQPWDARACPDPDPEMRVALLAQLELKEEQEREAAILAGESIPMPILKKSSKPRKRKIVDVAMAAHVAASSSVPVEEGKLDVDQMWDYIFDITRQLDSTGQTLVKKLEGLGVSVATELNLLSEEEVNDISDCLKPIPKKGFLLMMKGKWNFR